jgi:hypothetical protein
MKHPREQHHDYLTLREAADQVRLPLSWFYERSRRDALPGLRRVGKYIRLNRDDFFAAVEAGELR